VLLYEISLQIFKFFSPTKQKSIAGQLALVTGGANGLGRAIAIRLAKEKCDVVVGDINLIEAEKTAAEISEKYNVQTAAFKVDVSNYDAIQKLKNDIEESLGSVDILVNNAGILSAISLREGTPNDIQKLIDVNLTSHFWTVRTFLKSMIDKKRGHIVAIASMGGKVTFPLGVAYCATKFGVKGFMMALYDELCIDNTDEFVKLTTVFPGFINTRKELSDVLDQMDEMVPRLSPQYVADEVIKGILLEKVDVTIPSIAWILQVVNWLPTRVVKFAKRNLAPVAHLKRF